MCVERKGSNDLVKIEEKNWNAIKNYYLQMSGTLKMETII